MALVHLTREVPEKGYTVTSMDCQEEFVDNLVRRGWKVVTEKKVKVEEKKDEFKFSSESSENTKSKKAKSE